MTDFFTFFLLNRERESGEERCTDKGGRDRAMQRHEVVIVGMETK